VSSYPSDWPQAERGSPLEAVYQALHDAGSSYESGQDFQCPAHDDNRASLGVREGDSAPVLLFCQAGCQTSAILDAIGLRWSDVMVDARGILGARSENAKPRPKRTTGAVSRAESPFQPDRSKASTVSHRHSPECELIDSRTWWYTDESDVRISGVRRLDFNHEPHKQIVQLRANRDDPKPRDARYVLYRLGDVLEQCARGGRIVLVEGEPSVDAALSADWEVQRKGSRRRSMVVTTMRSGAGKESAWRDEYTETLQGALEVVIVADRDLAGLKHAKLVLGKLRAAGVPCRVVCSATRGKGDDLVEHIAAGGTFATLERVSARELSEEIARLIDLGEVHEMAHGSDDVWPSPGDPRAIAIKFRDLAFRDGDGRLLLKHWRGDFWTWAGSAWRNLPANELESMLEEKLHDAVYLKPGEVEGTFERIPMQVTTARIKDIMHFMANIGIVSELSEPPLFLDGSHADDRFISLANGNLSLSTLALTEHTPALFNLNALPFEFDASAKCPEWVKFLHSLWPSDRKSIRLLQEVMGYIVSMRNDMEKIILMVGPTRSGKSTIARVIESLMGLHNIAAPTFESLADSFGLQPLLGKSVAIIADARLSGRNAQGALGLMLRLSGRDATTVNRKGKETWTGHVPARFVIVSNEAPNFKEDSTAFAHRMIMVRMTETFLGREDLDLFTRISDELPGIFNWALRGLARLDSQRRFTVPRISLEAEREMVRLTSPISAFVEDMCTLDPDAVCEKEALWSEWRVWAQTHGEAERSATVFGRSLNSAFAGVVTSSYRREASYGREGGRQHGGKRVPVYRGIRLTLDR
jgi:putative DNA primase/helicase